MVSIRELTPRDSPAVQHVFSHLSDRSRLQRYLGYKRWLLPVELQRLLAVDHWHHEALVALAPPPRAPVAIARYVRTVEFDVAEVAVEVRDEWQRQGVGTQLLLELAARAAAGGIRWLVATSLSDNPAALTLAARLAPTEILGSQDGVLQLRLRLPS